jgi:hypothetical protein
MKRSVPSFGKRRENRIEKRRNDLNRRIERPEWTEFFNLIKACCEGWALGGIVTGDSKRSSG